MGGDAADPTSPIEDRLRQLCSEGRFSEAAAEWVEAYGPEIMTFLNAVASAREESPPELFSSFCESLLVSLPRFRWECTARTWSYRLARNEWHHALRRERRRRIVPLSEAPAVWAAAERVRTSTAIEKRTSVKDEFRALRDALPADDRMLLVLRVDRNLDWIEVARVMSSEEGLGEEDLERLSTRLRKRFQRVKQRIRALAVERGMISPD